MFPWPRDALGVITVSAHGCRDGYQRLSDERRVQIGWVHFVEGCGSWQVSRAPVDGHTPKSTWTALIRPDGLKTSNE